MIKMLTLVKSYFTRNKNISVGYKIVKKNFFDKSIHKNIWQVVDYDLYKGVRQKTVGGLDIKVGLDFTVNFLKKQKFTYKVLIISTDSLESSSIKSSLVDFFDAAIVVDNIGLDLGAHKAGLDILSDVYSMLPSIPFVVSNSSFKPVDLIAINTLLTCSYQEHVMIGASFAYGPRYYFLKKMHLQSFFLISNYSNFKFIFGQIELNTNDKLKIIRDGEIKITEIAFRNKMTLICYDGHVFRIFNKPLYSLFFYDHRNNHDLINSL